MYAKYLSFFFFPFSFSAFPMINQLGYTMNSRQLLDEVLDSCSPWRQLYAYPFFALTDDRPIHLFGVGKYLVEVDGRVLDHSDEHTERGEDVPTAFGFLECLLGKYPQVAFVSYQADELAAQRVEDYLVGSACRRCHKRQAGPQPNLCALHRLPQADFHPPSVRDLVVTWRVIDRMREEPGIQAVVMHCNASMGRTPTMLMSYHWLELWRRADKIPGPNPYLIADSHLPGLDPGDDFEIEPYIASIPFLKDELLMQTQQYCDRAHTELCGEDSPLFSARVRLLNLAVARYDRSARALALHMADCQWSVLPLVFDTISGCLVAVKNNAEGLAARFVQKIEMTLLDHGHQVQMVAKTGFVSPSRAGPGARLYEAPTVRLSLGSPRCRFLLYGSPAYGHRVVCEVPSGPTSYYDLDVPVPAEKIVADWIYDPSARTHYLIYAGQDHKGTVPLRVLGFRDRTVADSGDLTPALALALDISLPSAGEGAVRLRSLAWSPDLDHSPARVAMVAEDGLLALLEVRLDPDASADVNILYEQVWPGLQCVRWSPSGHRLAIGQRAGPDRSKHKNGNNHREGSVRLLEPDGSVPGPSFFDRRATPTCMEWVHDTLWVGDSEGVVDAWRVAADGAQERSLEHMFLGHEEPLIQILRVELASQQTWFLVSVDQGRHVRVWRLD